MTPQYDSPELIKAFAVDGGNMRINVFNKLHLCSAESIKAIMNVQNTNMYTILYFVAGNKPEDVLPLLLEYGASQEAILDCWDHAEEIGNYELMKMLANFLNPFILYKTGWGEYCFEASKKFRIVLFDNYIFI